MRLQITITVVACFLASIACVQIIKDETNFTTPKVRTCRTIAVLPTSNPDVGVDAYLAEALSESWLSVTVLPPEAVLAALGHKDRRSFWDAGYSTKECGQAVDEDAIVWSVINSTAMAPPDHNIYERNTMRIVHCTTYLVDLKTSDTAACFHNKASHLLWSSDNRHSDSDMLRLVKDNVQGLLKLAVDSGHLDENRGAGTTQ